MQRNSADQIAEILGTHVIGNDHDREERRKRGKQQRVNADHNRSFFQVPQLGVGDLAIDLRQGLFAAHRQHGMTEADEHDEHRQMADPAVLQ